MSNLHYVLRRNGGQKILVTTENQAEYRNSVEFIRLHEPVPEEAPVKKSVAPKKKAKKKS